MFPREIENNSHSLYKTGGSRNNMYYEDVEVAN